MLHEFDQDDIRLLDEVLTQHLHTLLFEIANADDRAFRADLRLRYERLDAMRRRVTGSPVAVGINEREVDLDSGFH